MTHKQWFQKGLLHPSSLYYVLLPDTVAPVDSLIKTPALTQQHILTALF